MFASRHFQLETTPCGRWYITLQPIHWLRLGGCYPIVVPRGFASDGASVPRAFWRLFPPLGRYTGAAVLHDWLYRTKAVSRAVADEIFHEACRDLGVPPVQALVLFYAVRAFGWLSYGRRTDLSCERGGNCHNFADCNTRQAMIKLGVAK
jgi:hypothetical protein